VPAVTAIDNFPAFPQTQDEREEIARTLGQQCVTAWRQQGLPEDRPLYLLLSRPGEIGKGKGQMTHVLDQSAAREEELGGVAVAVVLTDVIQGVEDLIVKRVNIVD